MGRVGATYARSVRYTFLQGALVALPKTEKIWYNGKLIKWDEAQIHVLSHVVSYGSGLCEGVRCYHTPQGPAIFRLSDHMQRLIHSARIYRIEVPYDLLQLCQACVDVIRENRLPAAYLRPIVLRGYGSLGVLPADNPIETYIAAWDWGHYLGNQAQESGVDVCVSSWTRIAPNTLPAMSKAAANYMNSQLIKMEAVANGYSEGIALDSNGHVSEGSGENLFLVRNGTLITPPLSASVLPGITRDSGLTIAAELKIPVLEQTVPREALYLADEVFFSGTAVEVTPIRSVDRITVGKGTRGPITAVIQSRFFDLAMGRSEDRYGWLTPVPQLVTA